MRKAAKPKESKQPASGAVSGDAASQPITYEEALAKVLRYCAYQDRCWQEVYHKLEELGLAPEWWPQLAEYLTVEKYVNEQRFAESYTRGKFYHLGWGRKKISFLLRQKGITKEHIEAGLEQIDEVAYLRHIENKVAALLLKRKRKEAGKEGRSWQSPEAYVAQQLVRTGFEPALVWKAIRDAGGADDESHTEADAAFEA